VFLMLVLYENVWAKNYLNQDIIAAKMFTLTIIRSVLTLNIFQNFLNYLVSLPEQFLNATRVKTTNLK